MTGRFIIMLIGVPEEDAERIRDCMLQNFIMPDFKMKKSQRFKGRVNASVIAQLKNDG